MRPIFSDPSSSCTTSGGDPGNTVPGGCISPSEGRGSGRYLPVLESGGEDLSSLDGAVAFSEAGRDASPLSWACICEAWLPDKRTHRKRTIRRVTLKRLSQRPSLKPAVANGAKACRAEGATTGEHETDGFGIFESFFASHRFCQPNSHRFPLKRESAKPLTQIKNEDMPGSCCII